MTSILAFAGSTRADSYNKKLSRIAADSARGAGAEVRWIDLADYRMPLYDGDLEKHEGIPATALQFRELLEGHQAFLISCPEYNGSISGVLKNAIDWASRPLPEARKRDAFRGKVAGLLGASPGRFGAIRSLLTAQAILARLGAHVLPDLVTVSNAHEAFDESGNLREESNHKRVESLARMLVDVTTRLTQ
jgi:NAD(P)H-dependent FMN reductase